MSKKKRAVAAGRMTPAIIAAVVAEIQAYGSGKRERPLTWQALSEFSGFSHVSLWKKAPIKAAFGVVQQAQRPDATPSMKAPKTTDERVSALQSTVEELRSIIRAYDERWALQEHNIHRLGIEPDELRRPLDELARDQVKSRRMHVIR